MNKASGLCLLVSRYPRISDAPGAFRGSVQRHHGKFPDLLQRAREGGARKMFAAADKQPISIPPPEGPRVRDVPLLLANPKSHAGALWASSAAVWYSTASR